MHRDRSGDPGRIPIAAVIPRLRFDDEHRCLRHRVFQVDDVSLSSGRRHAARDVCEFIMQAQGTLDDQLNYYLQ